ncbi:YbaN family protein [Neptunicella sp. SCSIO 80796]|uniref:YbaN family protein n=1 Tax=Neptunicella plasticusilytica TaxID=3117012 RepID=UPI003A4D3A5B
MWLTKLHWRILALLFLMLGLIGIPLPGLPTVPFILLSAWAGSKGWPALENWLLNHPIFGESIKQWRRYGAIPIKAKILSSLMMLLSAIIFWLTEYRLYFKIGLSLMFVAVAIWIWRRPDSTDTNES